MEKPVVVSLRVRALLVLCGMASVAPLLAWVYDLGSFQAWFLLVTIPGLVAIVALSVFALQRPDDGLRQIISLSVVAGIVGTIGYDVFRVPFMLGWGYRLLSPIESYGVLLIGADESSGLTDFAGWVYHFSNGIGFALVYAAVASGRRWYWGLVWALVLEAGTVLTPFADDYQLNGKYAVITIAFAAHVPFGLALGFMFEKPAQADAAIHPNGEPVARSALALLLAALTIWLAPWSVERRGDLPPADLHVLEGRAVPEWHRVNAGECLKARNQDDATYEVLGSSSGRLLEPKQTLDICFDEGGVFRLRIGGGPFDGGFVIVED